MAQTADRRLPPLVWVPLLVAVVAVVLLTAA